MQKERNVFRIDTGRTHGWQVRIRRNGEWHRKFFSDSKFDSQEAAFEAAVEHRDDVLEDLPDLPGDPDEAGHLHTDAVDERRWESVTRTGVKGLGFTMKTYSQAKNDKRPYVNAYWTEEGTRRSTSYSVIKHGLSSALKRAAEALTENADHDSTVEEMMETAQPAIADLLEQADVREGDWQS